MFIVSLTYVKPVEEIDALMSKHVAWLRLHYRSGLFIASGRKIPRKGGIILATSDSRERLDRALNGDPFVKSGAATFEVTEFTASMTAPGAEILKSL